VGGDVGLFLETADVGTVIVVDVNVVGITPVDWDFAAGDGGRIAGFAVGGEDVKEVGVIVFVANGGMGVGVRFGEVATTFVADDDGAFGEMTETFGGYV